MRLGKYLSSLTREELNDVKDSLNMTEEELPVFMALAKGKSIIAVADMCGISTSTVSNRIRCISVKIDRI